MNFTNHPRLPLIPVAGLIVLFISDALVALGLVPAQEILLSQFVHAIGYFGPYGLALLSFFENIALVNSYFPGSVAILAGMQASFDSPARVVIAYFSISGGAIFGQLLTFQLAKHTKIGHQSNGSATKKSGISKSMWMTTALSYWHPHLASLHALRMGDEGKQTVEFLTTAAVGTLVWNIFWTVFVGLFGPIFTESRIGVYLMYFYFALWIGFSQVRRFREI